MDRGKGRRADERDTWMKGGSCFFWGGGLDPWVSKEAGSTTGRASVMGICFGGRKGDDGNSGSEDRGFLRETRNFVGFRCLADGCNDALPQYGVSYHHIGTSRGIQEFEISISVCSYPKYPSFLSV